MELMTTLFRHILRMRQISMAVLVSLIAVAAFTSYISGASGRSTASDFKKAEAMTENKLLGTWKQVKGKFNGKEHQIPEGTTQLKHVTSTHFMFIDIDKDGKVFFALGGPYTLKGGEYVETPEYGVGEVFKILKGKPQLFECKVEGSKWYHNGTLSSGLTIEEVWERVEPK
jgi:hypothetical protein